MACCSGWSPSPCGSAGVPQSPHHRGWSTLSVATTGYRCLTIGNACQKKFHTPAVAIWLIAVIAFLAGISDGIYAVIGTMSVIGLYSSYCIPIALKLRAQFRGIWTSKEDGPWHLGKWSIPVGTIACLWIGFLIILMVVSPTNVQLTSHLVLHYATGKIIFAVLVLLVINYLTTARKTFTGPLLGSYESLSRQLTNNQAATPLAQQLTPHFQLKRDLSNQEHHQN
ncbi:amino acid permease [Secundilactobacillus paracollinoides]|uniref:amino acid permease n=1 Tax=Secundilactobacillus paracollinoides TaxID=240427 RepID=UPI0021E71446|nr:amino acid permease [Secundilactobacillus paracollinoides]